MAANPRTLDVTIAASYEDVAIVRSLLPVFAKDLPFTRGTLLRLEICLAEALTNVVRHGYKDMVGGEIAVTLAARPDRLVMEIADEGRPMPDGARESIRTAAPPPDRDDTPVHELPEGGFGLQILKSVLDEVVYRRDGTRNVLTLTKYHVEARRRAMTGTV